MVLELIMQGKKKKSKNKDQLSLPNLGLDLLTPFYINRNSKPKLIKSPRCLIRSPHMHGTNICHYISANNSPRSFRSTQFKPSINNSPRMSAQAIQKRLTMQWDVNNTQQFKQKMKDLLKQYYDLQDKQKQHLNVKVKRQRVSQIAKISKSLQQLLQNNKRLYTSIRHECAHAIEAVQEVTEYEGMTKKQIQQLEQAKFIQYFTKRYIEKRSQDQEQDCIIDDQTLERKIDQIFKNQIVRNPSLIKIKLTKESNQNQEAVQEKQNVFASSFIGNPIKLEQNSHEEQNLKISEKIYKRLQLLKDAAKANRKSSDSSHSQLKKQQKQQDNKKLQQKLATADSGKDKFYQVIKQLLHRKRLETTPPAQTKSKRRGGVVAQEEYQNQMKKSSRLFSNGFNKKFNDTFNQRNILNTSQSNYGSQLRQSSKGKLKNLQQVIKLNKLKNNKSNNKSDKQEKTEKGRKKNIKNKQNGRESKISRTSVLNSKNVTYKSMKQAKQGSKHKTKMPKTALHYSKFLGKSIKAQNEKLSGKSEKFRNFRKYSTRQAFLSKSKNKLNINSKIDLNSQTECWLNENNDQPAINQQNSDSSENTSSQSSIVQDQNDARGRMTKYQQARLMYNMRNIKTRQGTFTNLQHWEQNSVRTRKRISICQQSNKAVHHLAPTVQNDSMLKTKRNSFSIKKSLQISQQPDEQLLGATQSSCHIQTRRKRNSLSKSQDSITDFELTRMSPFQQFDLSLVKDNITKYLKKAMLKNEKAKELYNFLMYMQQSRKIALEKQQSSYTLDLIKIQKEHDERCEVVNSLNIKADDYEGCRNIYDFGDWNQRDIYSENKKFIDKLDARAIQLMYWPNEQHTQTLSDLKQCSFKQIMEVPLVKKQ